MSANATRPVYSVEAEQSVLGALLLDNGAWDRAADMLAAEDFHREEHQLVYECIGALINANQLADVITVHERLESSGVAEHCGGLAYLSALAQSVPSAASVRHYASIVRERAMLRALSGAAHDVAMSVSAADGRSAQELVQDAEARIFRLGERGSRGRQGFQSADSLVVDLIDRVSELAEKGASDVTGTRTGLYDLDRMTAGLQGGDLLILAARPSMGKTALALNIAENVAINEGLPVVVFSMEMGASQLIQRMVSSVGRVDQQRLRTGALLDDDWGRLAEAADRVSKARIFIDETAGLTVAELRARARRQARVCGGKLGLIVIDYLQLMSGSGKTSENRATELSEISRGLKALAKELQCPVIALSQLNRSVEARTDKRPMMSDLRESGAIEQDADVIMFIYRDDYYNKESKEPGVAELIVSKQRNGPVGTVKLAFIKQSTKFDNLAAGGADV